MVNPEENILPQSESVSPDNLPPTEQTEEALPEGWIKTSDIDGIRKRFLLQIANANQATYPSMIHSVGYLLLILTFLDFIHLTIPPQFTNPNWELETMGQLVERVAIPLLGYLFVFYPTESEIPRLEFWLWRFLSWLALLLGIFYLLMIPLGFHNTLRVDQQNVATINNRISQQTQQVEQQKKLISELNSQQLDNLLNNVKKQQQLPDISPEELQQKLLLQLETNQELSKTQAQDFRKKQRITLLKTSFKWNLGALLSGVMFIVIWYLTKWVRVGR